MKQARQAQGLFHGRFQGVTVVEARRVARVRAADVVGSKGRTA